MDWVGLTASVLAEFGLVMSACLSIVVVIIGAKAGYRFIRHFILISSLKSQKGEL